MSAPTLGKSRERGASVLEVVIALAITGMIAAVTTQVAGFGLNAVERASSASASDARDVIRRRSVAGAFANISSGEDAFFADEAEIRWRGVLPGDDGARRSGVWRLTLKNGVLSGCADMEAPVCDESGAFDYRDIDVAFENARGEVSGEWPLGPAPHLLRLTVADSEITVAPRVRGFE